MPPSESAGQPDQLLSEVYPSLRRMAAACMAMQAPGHTLQPTALVHEAWIRLTAHASPSRYGSAGQFYTAAAQTMRHVLIDRARQRAGVKRGGNWRRVPFEVVDAVVSANGDEKLLLIHEALGRLEKEDPVRARVVLLKFYGGLSNREAAQEMGITERTVERYWAHAKAWLYDDILANQ